MTWLRSFRSTAIVGSQTFPAQATLLSIR